ncbi:alpha-tubulin suppressor-like RCC1 family protein [Ereboglobus sp. PH5-10]|uniref:RCC1 domain-containing protein n=1 Tax=Ereboglobus sp. PH5-10 TaxID=2940629 RepID=UPI0024055BE4|nr:immunoglobulin domain-containing protein [Ereboglobus sp. PH5-10]MDF9827274.1 alpha-tubulin suppressor-like RCC1 family protein [Ereboglobus sp. PH5-10]
MKRPIFTKAPVLYILRPLFFTVCILAVATSQANAANVIKIAGGEGHSLFVTNDGTLWAMGNNDKGELGDGTYTRRNTPVQVASNVITVAAGSKHSLFVKNDGTLWATGLNATGQLGNDDTKDINTPVQIDTDVFAVAAGRWHSLYVKSDGTLWAMGYNEFGQLGDGTLNVHNTPVQVATNVVAVAAGGNHSLFLKTDGTLWAMGYNGTGQLGVDSADYYPDVLDDKFLTPEQIATDVLEIAAGWNHTLFVKTNGELWAMGWNIDGQLGDGTYMGQGEAVQIATGVDFVAAGWSHSLFVKTDGTLWAMGNNIHGQLGDSTTTKRNSPVQVTTDGCVIAAGWHHSLFVKADGSLWSMGSNVSGQLGAAALPSQSAIPVYIAGDSLPVIATQPVSQTIFEGRSATFTVVATGPTPTYQWKKNNEAILGATSATYTIPSVKASDGGSYTVVVSNMLGFVTSNAAVLTVSVGGNNGNNNNSSGGGGGGAPSLLWLGVVGVMFALRRVRKFQALF